MKIKLLNNLAGPDNVRGIAGDIIHVENAARAKQLVDEGTAVYATDKEIKALAIKQAKHMAGGIERRG